MAIAFLKSKDNKNRKRRGRGNASGLGGECGRGHKGQKSRSGYSKRAGFEGGQTPLYRRLPKLNGFSNYRFKKYFEIINISDLSRIDDLDEITLDDLKKHSLISGQKKVKLLANGELNKSLKIHVHFASVAAIKKVANSKGEVLLINS
jgi:large subunit ribosomal protein L15